MLRLSCLAAPEALQYEAHIHIAVPELRQHKSEPVVPECSAVLLRRTLPQNCMVRNHEGVSQPQRQRLGLQLSY